MTRENAAKFIPLVKALAEGKIIQYKFPGKWNDLDHPSFTDPPEYYRIKPEPKLRAWRPEEVPVGSILREKTRHTYKFILAGCSEFGVYIESTKYHTPIEFSAVLEIYEHSIDGGKTWLPCGVLEGRE